MFNLQGSEIIVILLIALVVLGPERLPDAVRKAMQTYNELKKMGSGFQSEIKSAFDEPMREMRDTAQRVRDAADPNTFVAGAESAGNTEPQLQTDTATPSDNGADDAGHGIDDPGDESIAAREPPRANGATPPPRPASETPSSSSPPPPPPRPPAGEAAPIASGLPPLPPPS